MKSSTTNAVWYGRTLLFVGAFAVGSAVSAVACATSTSSDTSSDSSSEGGASSGAPGSGAQCTACIQDSDCSGGESCAQFGAGSFCAAPCPSGNGCDSAQTCTQTSGADGTQLSVCVPDNDACGSSVGPGGSSGSSGSSGAPAGMCGSLAGPTIAAGCHCSSKNTCAANGCYGGWWCNTATNKCQSPPTSGCGSSGGGGQDPAVDAGGPVTGAVGPTGGNISRLLFAVIGDTRPAVINDNSAYPTAVITKIFADVEALSPRPPFAISTGDYQFSTPSGGNAAIQLGYYMTARGGFSNVVFPAMGNHECTGATASNCGPGTTDGVTNNYTEFLSQMLSPIGQSSPSYVININASDNSWTSKFVFIGANAWTSTTASWLDSALAVPTTYTFIVRHEPKEACSGGPPGCSGSEAIMANHPYTLAIVGHTHTYGKTGPKQVTIGNGGAPLTGGANYGFGLLQQRADGAIQVDMVDYSTGGADTSFRFAINADGSAAP